MIRFFSCLAVVATLCAPVAAHADTLENFNFAGHATEYEGNFPVGSSALYTGSMLVDTTTGQALDLVFDNVNYPFDSNYLTQYNYSDAVEVAGEYLLLNGSGLEILDLVIPGSLIGYTGGNVCSISNPCLSNDHFSYSLAYINREEQVRFTDGMLTPTPEPSSLVLLGSGLLGVVGAARRRFSQEQ